jgi:hypothetical protein
MRLKFGNVGDLFWRGTGMPATDAGFNFETFGKNRRVGVDFDGLRLVAFRPQVPS